MTREIPDKCLLAQNTAKYSINYNFIVNMMLNMSSLYVYQSKSVYEHVLYVRLYDVFIPDENAANMKRVPC